MEMQKSKLMKNCMWLLSILLVCAFVFAGCNENTDATTVKPDETYGFSNPDKVVAEPDAGFVIDGILDEEAYKNSKWLKLQNTQGGAGVDIAMTSFYGEKGMYIVYDVTESSMIYVNPDRATYLNSCIEMYLASSNVANMKSNEIFEIDMLPTGELSVRQRTGRDNWVNAASSSDIMAQLGATTKGGPVNTEECTGYNLELFIPWEYLDYVGLNASEMKQDFIYINPVHITSYNYEGVNSGTDRYWYSFATQLGSDGWNDVAQYFRFGAKGVLGTVPVELTAGENCAISGNDSVIPGMMTTIEIVPDAGYALNSILVNGEEYIGQASYNKDGSVTLELRGAKEGLKISAAAETVTAGTKTLSGTVQVHKLGGDTLDDVSVSYKGPMGEKPIELDKDGKFCLKDLEQGHYIVTVTKMGYAPINRGIYLNRDVDAELVLEYQMFRAESGYNWILDDQNDGVLNRFGGSGKILSADSYDKFGVEATFKYDTDLAAMSDGDTFLQQRSGIQIKFSNGKYWRVDLMKENGVFKVQYATHNDSTLFTWKSVHKLTKEEIAKYQSEEGIKLSILRDGRVAWVCLEGRPVAIEVLDYEYSDLTAQIGFEGWIANQEIEEMPYRIFEDFKQNLWNFYFTTNTNWDISRQLQGVLTLPGGGTAAAKFYRDYKDFDITLDYVREHDYTGQKPGRTDILLEFDTNGDGKADKSVSFGITCTDPATNTCWLQTLGNANNYIPATRIKGLYKLSAEEAEKYLGHQGVELRVVRKGTEVYVFVEGNEVAIFDLTQNNSGVTADTPVDLSIRHYDAKSEDVAVVFQITGDVGEVEIDKIFKDNEKWDLTKQYEGVVSLPGGGTETTLQLFKKYQNIDFTVLAKENDATGKKPGRTDVLFEFDLDNDGTWDKNVSFGVVQLSGGRCVVQTLGWNTKFIPVTRINELYELDYAEALKYKGDGINLRVIRYGTNAYVYLEDKQVAVFDLTQNNSGVKADTKATVTLRHYDAVADEVVIPFTLTVPTEEPAVVPLPKTVFKSNTKWDLSKQNQGTVTVNGVEAIKGVASLPGGGTNAVAFYDRFTDIDLTINAKENKAASAANGGRTDILFEFDTNGDGTVDKSVSFGIVKWSATSSCIVETLGNSNNYIPASRKNTLYTLNADETAKYLADGVELRVVRSGTDVYVFVEGNYVSVFDLTQNNSGVTADMKATVSLRHYDAITDQVDIPFTVTDQRATVTVTDNSSNGTVKTDKSSYQLGDDITLSGTGADGYYLAGLKVDGVEVVLSANSTYTFAATKTNHTVEGIFRAKLFVDNADAAWDLSQQNMGRVILDGIEKTQGIATLNGGGSKAVAFRDQYTYIDITVTAKEYDTTGKKPGRTDILFEFENGKNVSFGVTCTRPAEKTCWVQTLGISTNHIPATRVNGLYQLSAAEAEKYLTGDGVELRVIRVGTNVQVYLEGKLVKTFDLTQNNSGVTADMPAKVSLRHYDAVADQVDIPFTVTDQRATVTVTDNSSNGTVNTDKDSYQIGDTIILSGVAEDGYYLAGMMVDGVEAVRNTDGTYSFAAAKTNHTVEGIFRAKLFVDNAKWDLTKQNQGAVVANGVQALKGEVTLPGGGTNAVAFRDQYTYIDLTINAKENKAATAKNGGRTDILFEFDTNGDGKVDKSVSFGIVKWSATSSCIVETLGNSNNYIPASRKNTLYTLNADETAAYLADGVELRVVRIGTNVQVYLEGKLVNTFDLTQNNSGVTADMPAKVSLRHYDAIADKVVIPFTVADSAREVIFKENYDASIWDVSGQSDGLVVLPNGGGATASPLEFSKKFTDVDLSLVVRDYPNGDNEEDARTDVEFVFDNGEKVTFGVVKTGNRYRIQTRAGTLLSWKTPYYIDDPAMIADYVVTEEEMNSGNPGGLNFRVVRYETEFYLYLNDIMVKGYDFSYDIDADTPVTVYLRHYDDKNLRVEIPFTVTDNVTISDRRLFTEKTPVTDYAYSFAVVPDIQIVTENDVNNGENNLAKLFDWIVANKSSKNIQYVFGLGDITDNNTAAEWALAQTQHAKLSAAGIPYSAVRGNHDMPGYRGGIATDAYNEYMGTDAYRAQFEGFYPDNNVANSWRTFTVGEVNYLMLTLDYGANDAVLNWASDIIAAHPNHNVIITTHAYLFRDGTTLDSGDIVPPSTSGGTNNGDHMWNKLVSKHENIVLVMCGHDPSESIVVNRSTGENGNVVTSMLIDAQDVEAQEGSMGMVAMLYFSEDGKNMQVEYYSTAKEKYFMSSNQFSAELDVVDGEPTVYGTGYVPVSGQQVKTTSSFTSFPRTIEVTFNRSSNTTRAILLGNCGGSSNDYFNLECPANENIIYLNLKLGGTTYQHSFNKISYPLGETVRVTVVLEDAAVKCYVNGVLAQERTNTNGGNGSKPMADLWASVPKANLSNLWGIGNDLRNYPFIGTIYDIALWSDVRTAEEIAGSSIANLGTAGYNDNLLAAYNFRAGYKFSEANFAKDLSGNGNHLTGTLNVGTSTTAPVLTFAAITVDDLLDEEPSDDATEPPADGETTPPAEGSGEGEVTPTPGDPGDGGSELESAT